MGYIVRIVPISRNVACVMTRIGQHFMNHDVIARRTQKTALDLVTNAVCCWRLTVGGMDGSNLEHKGQVHVGACAIPEWNSGKQHSFTRMYLLKARLNVEPVS
jgi:hypothetical protein